MNFETGGRISSPSPRCPWLFIEFTSYSHEPELKCFLRALDCVAEWSSKVTTRIQQARGSSRSKHWRRTIDQVRTGKLRCNSIHLSFEGQPLQKAFPLVRGTAHFAPNCRAFCWDRLDLPAIDDALASSIPGEWENVMFVAGAQKMGGAMPSVLSLSMELDWAGEVTQCESLLIALVQCMTDNSDSLPSDVRMYSMRGEDAFARGAFNVAVQTQAKCPKMEDCLTRFLLPREWIGAATEDVADLAAALNRQSKLRHVPLRVPKASPFTFVRCETDPDALRLSGADRFFVSL